MKRSILGAGIGILLAVVLMQYLEGPALAETTGVVKELAGAPAGTSSMQTVTLTLADGSQVQAKLIPGCLVFPGDSVRVQSFRGNLFWQRDYLVLGPKM